MLNNIYIVKYIYCILRRFKYKLWNLMNIKFRKRFDFDVALKSKNVACLVLSFFDD